MTNLEKAIRHIKTRADAWAVKEVEQALSQEPCDDAISRKKVEEMIKAEMPERGAWEIGGNKGDVEKQTVCEVCVDLLQSLNELPSVNPQPCDDAISREELLKAIDTWDKFGYTETGCFVREPKGDYVPYIHYVDVIKCIKGMPSVTQKSGKWIVYNYPAHECVYCSNCKTEYYEEDLYLGDSEFPKFCPNCGARMVESQESEDKE